MKYRFLVLIALLVSSSLSAQVDYTTRTEGGDIIVSIVSDKDYDHPASTFITGEFTLAWNEVVGENIISNIESLSDFPFTYDPTGVPFSQLAEGQYFQKFGFTQPVSMDLFQGDIVDVLRIDFNEVEFASKVTIERNPPLTGGKASFINVFAEQWTNLELSSNEEVALGVEDNDIIEVSLFPNPATDNLFIQLPADLTGDLQLSLIDLNGKEILSQRLNNGATQRLDVSAVAMGAYYVQLSTDGAVVNRQKLVKVN